jgi:hypothetical protein
MPGSDEVLGQLQARNGILPRAQTGPLNSDDMNKALVLNPFDGA